MTEYSIINMNLDTLNEELKKTDIYYDTIFKARTMYEIAHWLEDHNATDDLYSIEIYNVDEDGEFLVGSDYDTPSNFLKIRAYQIRLLTDLSQAAFAKKYRIPKRTIESWEAVSSSARRDAPDYVLDLLERAVREDF